MPTTTHGHRTTDPTRVRTAAHAGHDVEMANADYRRAQARAADAATRRAFVNPSRTDQDPAVDITRTRLALRESLRMPWALSVQCPEHAGPGQFCFPLITGGGVCQDRWRRGLVLHGIKGTS